MADPRNLDMLVRLQPVGPYDTDEGSTFRADLSVAGTAMDVGDDQRLELLDEILPDRAEDLLSSWERVYNIHRVAGLTTAQRQAAVVARRRFLPDFRPSTIDTIVEEVAGVVVDVVEPFAFRCDEATSVCDDPYDVLDGAFVFFVEADSAAALAAGAERAVMDETIGALKPSHTIGISRFTGAFRCDDAYSLCDRDLLGA